MAIPAGVVVVPLGLLFFCSGLIVNLLQAICFVCIRPLSKNIYRRFNRVVAEMLWLQLVWLIDWWAALKIKVHTYPETFRLMGKEHALVICNHKSDIDWLVGWVLAQRSGCLGSTLAVMKKSSKFLPVHVHIKRHVMKNLPETDDAVGQWCKDAFVAKDALLDKHAVEQTFGDQELQITSRPWKSLVVVTSWAFLLISGSIEVLYWSSFLSSWEGIAFILFGLSIVTILMQILIRFSQSERSNPAGVAPR